MEKKRTEMKECKKQLSRCCRIKNRSSSACLRQISLTGGIPFSVFLPKAPASVDAGRMTTAELRNAIMAGIDDVSNGNTVSAKEVFEEFRERHK